MAEPPERRERLRLEDLEARIRDGDSLTLETDWIGAVVLRLVGVPRPVLVRGR